MTFTDEQIKTIGYILGMLLVLTLTIIALYLLTYFKI